MLLEATLILRVYRQGCLLNSYRIILPLHFGKSPIYFLWVTTYSQVCGLLEITSINTLIIIKQLVHIDLAFTRARYLIPCLCRFKIVYL